MNISYEWLKEYIPTALDSEAVAEALTSIGLETGGIERYESIEGGLKGLVIGEVLTCVDHENSDHLHITTVSIGEGEPLQIVCGAPNVHQGARVVVATIGTVLGSGDNTFTIKKGKIRGVESFGMLCGEDEIGVGTDKSGIILLDPENAPVGMTAGEYYGITTDEILEVDLTPNRIDAASHFGVARDLAAYQTQNIAPIEAKLPEVSLEVQGTCPIEVVVEAKADEVVRFQGLVIRNVKVAESPEWLRLRLESIGLRSINNIVDVTNYVLHEVGQPLHSYDLSEVKGGKLKVGFAQEGSALVMLDDVERKLSDKDLVISDSNNRPLCVAGVMGAKVGGTHNATTDIFLESANFNSSLVRKTARRLGLSTDSSFRFERGLDPNRTDWALRRVASLILELCPTATIDGGIFDHYPEGQADYTVELSLQRMDTLIGKTIPRDEVRRILGSLEIKIVSEDEDVWTLSVPRYRIDVTRDVDVIEDVMRIYGYNNIEMSGYIHANLSTQTEVDRSYRRKLMLSEQLTGAGFSEILNNSLSAEAFYEGLETSFPKDKLVHLMNPLSAELGVMRQTLLFGGLQSISRNLRRQQKSFLFYEWGNCYAFNAPQGGEAKMKNYQEGQRLGLWLAGQRSTNSWLVKDDAFSPFELKAQLEFIFDRLGINLANMKVNQVDNWDIFAGKSLEIVPYNGNVLARLGQVKTKLCKEQEINIPVYYAELEWDRLNAECERSKVKIKELSKFPIVKRDLSLLLDVEIPFSEIELIAKKCGKKLLKSCELFDVYDGKNLPEGKKSYAVSFYLQDAEATMSDKQIDATMTKIQATLKKQLGAELR